MADSRVRISILALVAVTLGASGCGGDDGEPPPSCLPDCPGDRGYDAVSYDLHARFDWTSETLTATEDISVAIAASPVIELDAGVVVTAVHAGDRALAFVADPATAKIRIDLTPIAASTPVAFTVDYTAMVSSALRLGGPRDDDPVAARAVFTDSEPDRARLWLVAKDDPSDRALWSVDVAVAPDQDVLANGARVSDSTAGAERVVGYALDKPIPTYLMAFAAGDLVHADRTTGRVPLSVWYRRGLAVDPDATLDVVADAMATYETKLGPYPWDSYPVFHAPGYGGGM
jgi:aminopeptidase N